MRERAREREGERERGGEGTRELLQHGEKRVSHSEIVSNFQTLCNSVTIKAVFRQSKNYEVLYHNFIAKSKK